MEVQSKAWCSRLKALLKRDEYRYLESPTDVAEAYEIASKALEQQPEGPFYVPELLAMRVCMKHAEAQHMARKWPTKRHHKVDAHEFELMARLTTSKISSRGM